MHANPAGPREGNNDDRSLEIAVLIRRVAEYARAAKSGCDDAVELVQKRIWATAERSKRLAEAANRVAEEVRGSLDSG